MSVEIVWSSMEQSQYEFDIGRNYAKLNREANLYTIASYMLFDL